MSQSSSERSLEGRRLIVTGGGGHAMVVIDALHLAGAQIDGLIDPNLVAGTKGYALVPVLGDDALLETIDPATVILANGVGSLPGSHQRRVLFDRFVTRGFRFAIVVHASAVIAQDVTLGHGAQIMAGAVLQPGAIVGDNSLVNTRASVDHGCRVGDHVHLAPGVTLSGDVVVEDRTHIGTGASVIQGVTIGCDALIGAGAVVTRDVKPRATVRREAISE